MASDSTTRVSTALPIAEPAFKGVVGKTYKDSTADFPQPVRPLEGAPNILLFWWTISASAEPRSSAVWCQRRTSTDSVCRVRTAVIVDA